MEINQVLSSFDIIGRKGFDFSQVASELISVDEKEKKKPEFRYEVVAMQLIPSQFDNPWGSYYYGPRFILSDQEGNPVYYPSIDDITSEAIMYWERRAQACTNPLLKVRYAGLVWDFKKDVAKKNFEPWLYRLYIDSMLQVCNEDYCRHPVVTVNLLERLFVLTKNSDADLKSTKDAYIAFEARHADDHAVRMWASRFILMVENKKSFTEDEKRAIVKEHEERLNRVATPNANGHLDPWLVQNQAGLLARYYISLQQKNDVKRVLNMVEAAFEHEASILSIMQLMANFETVCQEYNKYGLKEDYNLLTVKLQKLGERVKDEMQPYQTEFTIPKEIYDQADEAFGDKAESNAQRWRNFAGYFIPNKSHEEIELKEFVKKYPLKYMMGNKLMDPKGHPLSYVGPYESDPDGQLVLHMANKLNLQDYYLRIAINKLLTSNTLTVDNVIKFLIEPSPLFEEDRYEIIREAIQFFIDGRYVLFSHLIVPQIETAIRNMVEMSGVTILKPQNKQQGSKGNQIRTLDELLREKCVEEVFGADGALYLQLVLTNQKALNIRNLLCHGIMPPVYFGVSAAGRLLHILVMLGLVRCEPIIAKE